MDSIIIPIFMLVFFGAFTVGVISVAKGQQKRREEEQRNARLQANTQKPKSENSQKPKKKTALKSNHTHSGIAESYKPIVGSLGQVSDEGCAELDGVRLIEDDEAYDLQIEADRPAIAKAVILGELLNTPRFKTPWNPKK